MIDVAPSAHQALVGRAAELERLGFEIEGFGPGTIKVSAVPALLKTEDSSKALLALAEDLEGLDRGAQVQDALQRIAATTACHAAVKANYPLTFEKMAHILDELRATAYSTVCPHGRPVMLQADAPGDREELRSDLDLVEDAEALEDAEDREVVTQSPGTISAGSDNLSACGSCWWIS